MCECANERLFFCFWRLACSHKINLVTFVSPLIIYNKSRITPLERQVMNVEYRMSNNEYRISNVESNLLTATQYPNQIYQLCTHLWHLDTHLRFDLSCRNQFQQVYLSFQSGIDTF